MGHKYAKVLLQEVKKGKRSYENSILEFFVVCEEMLPHITSMEVDEGKPDISSNYTQVRRGGRVVNTKHVPIEKNLDFIIFPTHPTRNTIYNFKSQQGRDTLKELCNETNEFSRCFLSVQSLQIQNKLWKP